MKNWFSTKTASLTEGDIVKTLSDVAIDGKDIVSLGMVSAVSVKGDKVSFLVTISQQDVSRLAWLESACEKAVRTLDGVKSVSVVMTAETKTDEKGGTPMRPPPIKKAIWNTEPLPHVKKIIAVASGKGGVGKSTTSVNLAHALTKAGKRVGLLDADIYGPSLPRMMHLEGKPEVVEGRIIPIGAYGIACMSIGLLVGEESAIIWRGPQATKALAQMLRDVNWGTADTPLDVLLIDMPPGTGDIHLSLVQQVPVNGAIIVTTPQEVALADARKSADMFKKVNVPILGIIENMSGFAEPSTGKIHAIFGEGGGKKLAESSGSQLLGQVPIDITLREASDNGIRYEDRAKIYESIAKLIL